MKNTKLATLALFAALSPAAAQAQIRAPALIIIGLIHWEAFRTWQGLILPLLTPLAAVEWSKGFMGIANVPLDIFNMFNSNTPDVYNQSYVNPATYLNPLSITVAGGNGLPGNVIIGGTSGGGIIR